MDVAVQPDTKVEISEEAVKRNEKEEPLRVFDNTPAGKFARPESERRPEMGNTNFFSVMRFDGPAPETINGRLAMLGFTWAVAAEVMTGQSVAQQVRSSSLLLKLCRHGRICCFSESIFLRWEASRNRGLSRCYMLSFAGC